MSARAARWLTWWRVSGTELSALDAALSELLSGGQPADSAAGLARAELAQLSDRVAEAEVRAAALRADCDLLRTLAGGDRDIQIHNIYTLSYYSPRACILYICVSIFEKISSFNINFPSQSNFYFNIII